MLVYTISKGTNKSFVYDIYHGVQGEQGPQGEQGIQGLTGPQGAPGTAATIQVGSVTSGSAPSVNNVGTDTAAIFDFVLEKGDQGPVGQAAGFGTPSAVASALPAGSTPTASVVASGDATQKVFDFSFGIPAGVQGPTGPTGPQGPTGAAAGFGTPTASATGLPVGSTPTASVSASGADTAKVFAFEFGIPAGSESWNIEVNYFTSSTMVLKAFKNNVAYSGTIWAYLTYGDGTTSQRTPNPMMLTASSGTITITSSEFSDIATVLADATKTNFYFEFQETFTGSIFYSVSYVRGKLTDVWEVAYKSYNNSKYHFFNLFKNGEWLTSGNFYVEVTKNYLAGGSASLGGGMATYSGTSWHVIASSDPDDSSASITLHVYKNSSYGERLCVGTIPVRAPSIANNVTGYATGDQVYDYVDTQIGNINTILQSI